MQKALSYFLGGFMVFAGVMHLVSPDFYGQMIPDFISEDLANILAFVTEVAVGVMLILPRYRHWGGLGFMLLMIAFLPIHIWDYTKDVPYVGSKAGALVRLAVQLLLIYAGWWIYRFYKKVNSIIE